MSAELLEPRYSDLADRQMDTVEHDKERRDLWNAIVDAIELICDHPGSAARLC